MLYSSVIVQIKENLFILSHKKQSKLFFSARPQNDAKKSPLFIEKGAQDSYKSWVFHQINVLKKERTLDNSLSLFPCFSQRVRRREGYLDTFSKGPTLIRKSPQ